jgi:hypothetical protein
MENRIVTSVQAGASHVLTVGTVAGGESSRYIGGIVKSGKIGLFQRVKWEWVVKSFGGSVTVLALGIIAYSLGETIGIHGWPSFLVPLTGSLDGYALPSGAGFVARVAANLAIWTTVFYGMGWISSRIPADSDFF